MKTRMWRAVFVLLTVAAAPCGAQVCGSWSRLGAEPPFGGASLNAVTYGDGIFVAVGDGGLIVTSPDGVVWIPQENLETSNLLGITWNGARYVAVGGWGVVLVSEDAASWRRIDLACDQQLTAVTWSGARFIAVGEGATILSSGDGEAWEAAATGGGEWVLRSVACGAGVCLAGGSYLWSTHYQGTMLRSADGLAWQPVAAEYEFPLHAFDILWTGQRFVAVGSSVDMPRVGWSDSGETWTFGSTVAPGPPNYSAVAMDGNEILAFGDAGKLLISPDGANWSERGSTLGWWVNDAVWADGQWVAVGSDGQTAVSEDGVRWHAAVPALFDSFFGRPGATNGSVIVAVAGDATSWLVPYRSVDGIAWHRDASVGILPIWLLQSFAGGFVGRTSDGFASSPDGVTWTRRPLPPPNPAIYEIISGMACSPVRCVAVGNEVLTSDDALAWSRSALPAGRQLFDVAWTGSRFVAIGLPDSGGDALSLESTDGLVWESRTQSGLAAPTMLAAHGGRLVAIGGGQGRVFTAAAGQPWTELVLASYDDLRALTWTGSFFAALGRKADNVLPALWVSGDGTTWSEVAVPAGYDLRGIFGDGPHLYLLGERGTILSTTCSGYSTGRAPRRRLPPRP